MRIPFSTFVLDTTRPGVRQLASTVGLGIAITSLLVVPNPTVDVALVVVVAVAVLAITALAFLVPWDGFGHRWTLALPLASLLAFGVFRLATGGSFSVYSSLLILPVVWIAAGRGRSMVLVAALGTGCMMALPYVVGAESWSAQQGTRVLFAPLIFAMLAAVVNELAAQSRRQVAAAGALADAREALLRTSEASGARLEAAADELRSAEAFHRSIWSAIRHQAVVITDTEGRIVEWGPGAERLLGVDRRAAIGRMAIEFLRPGEDERASGLRFEALLALAEDDEVADGLTLRTADGGAVPVDVTYSPRLDRSGETVGYILVAHDMTQAHESSRLKDEFVGTVSHELRTPLGSVLGYIELTREDEAGLSETQTHFLGVAERNAKRLLALVADLLFVAQVDAGRFPLELERVDVGRVALASAETAMPAAARAGVEIAVPPAVGPMLVRGDGMRLGQAIDNLLSNAVKFTPRDGTVTLSVDRVGDEVRVAIADTGLGIPEEEMRRLFTRFFRSTTSARQAVPGVGLGLNITRAIVDAHGGEISASSVDGEGTTFVLALPALDR